jgi:Zn-dependent metalloprotease
MKKTCYIFAWLAACFTARSQITIDTTYFYFDTLSNYYFPKQDVNIAELTDNTLGVFKSRQHYTFVKSAEYTMEGKTFSTFDQYFNGIKMNGNSYFITTEGGIIKLIAGRVAVHPINSPAGLIGPDEAINGLIASIRAYRFKWEDAVWEENIKEEKNDPLASNYPQTDLRIYKQFGNNFDEPDAYYYAYPILISALYARSDSSYTDTLFYVNAFDGSVIEKQGTTSTTEYRSVKSANVFVSGKHSMSNDMTADEGSLMSLSALPGSPGYVPFSVNSPMACNNSCNSTGVTIHYYGGQTINTSQFTYLFVCNNRLKNNCNGATLYTRRRGNSNWEDYRATNNSWPNQNDKVGITGHWCLEKTYETFKNMFNYHSFNNAYSQVNLVIDNQGQSMWENSTSAIYVGKFQSTASYQAVLDIVGHEYGHGILQNSSGLGGNQANFSSIATINAAADEHTIAEGFNDIFGQLVEYYTNSNYSTTGAINDFVHGGNNPNGYVCGQTRSMVNPAQTCNPTTMFGNNWTPALTLSNNLNDFDALTHNNSTVLSHWFYLLAQGGSGTNDNNVNYCVSGIGQTNAGKIAFVAATNLINNYNRNMYGARYATIQAAIQLFGAGSNEVAQTTAAWYAVGVGPQFTGPVLIQNMTITGTYHSHYNAKTTVQNVTVNTGPVYISSNTEIEVLPVTSVNAGSYAELYIAPGCNGGARMATTPQEGNDQQASSESINLTEAKDFNILPNPNNGSFTLKFDAGGKLPNLITVRDITGKEIKTVEDPEAYEYDFNFSSLNSGMYFINAYYPDKTISRKFIKN